MFKNKKLFILSFVFTFFTFCFLSHNVFASSINTREDAIDYVINNYNISEDHIFYTYATNNDIYVGVHPSQSVSQIEYLELLDHWMGLIPYNGFGVMIYHFSNGNFVERTEAYNKIFAEAILADNSVLSNFIANPYFTNGLEVRHATIGNFLLAPPVQETTILVPIVEQVNMSLVLAEVVSLLPVILSVLVSLLAFYKAFKALATFLRKS